MGVCRPSCQTSEGQGINHARKKPFVLGVLSDCQISQTKHQTYLYIILFSFQTLKYKTSDTSGNVLIFHHKSAEGISDRSDRSDKCLILLESIDYVTETVFDLCEVIEHKAQGDKGQRTKAL